VTASLAGGGLVLTDADGQVVAETSMLRMWDASTDAFGDPANVVPVDAELVNEDGRQVLELSPAMEFLTDPKTVYPVTVDPNFVLTPDEDPTIEPGTNTDGKNRSDTYVTDAYPDSSFVGDWSLRVGTPNGIDRYRSWVNFNVNPYAGLSVTKAELKLYQYGSGTCLSRRMDQLLATTWWNTDGDVKRTWNRQPGAVAADSRFASWDSFNHSTDCGGRAWETIDVTPIVSAWTGLQKPRFGMMLKTPADRELMTGWEKRFCSADLNTTGSGFCQDARKPELRITYTPEIGDQGWYSQTDHPLNDRTTLKVNHRSGNAYLQANDVQVKGLGLDLTLGRRYNSRSDTPGSFGPKWSLSGGPDVWLEKVDQWRYAYHAPDGAEFGPFVREAESSSDSNYKKFLSPAGGVGADLKEDPNGTFVLTFRQSQQKYTFTPIGTAGHLYLSKHTERSDNNSIIYDYVSGTTRLSAITDTAGRTYQVDYNTGGQINKITENNGPTTRTWSYDYTNGRLTSYTDPAGNQTTYAWALGPDSTDQTVATITHPANDSGERPTTVLATGADQTTGVTYKGASLAEDAGYEFTYNLNVEASQCETKAAGSDRLAIVDSREPGNVTTYCFTDRSTGALNDNANNAKTTVIDGNNNTRSASYSPDNQPETGTSGTDATTVGTYGDPAAQLGDQLQSISDPMDKDSASGTKTTFTYDKTASFDGHKYLPVSVIDGNGDCTGYDYDDKGRLTDTWIGRTPNSNNRCDGTNGSGGFHYQAAYNSDGTVQSMTDPNAGATPTLADKTVYTYWQPDDAGFVAGTKGQLKNVQKPGGDCSNGSSRRLCTSFTYDGLSRTKTMTDGRGKTTTYSYDALDRTTQVLTDGATSCDHAAGTCVTYDYDAEGNLTRRVDALGTTTFDYDRLNRQTRQNTPDGVQVAYSYTLDGKIATMEQTVPGQPADVTTYSYDNANQIDTVINPALGGTGQIGIGHDSNNRLTRTTFPSAEIVNIFRSYTNAGRPQKIYTRTGTTTADQLTDYTYTWTKPNNSGSQDDTNQLQKLDVTGSTPAITYTAEYDYNGRGQLVSDTRTNGGGPSFTYTYDDAGNLASKTTNGTTTHYGYDRAGQLCWRGPSTGTTPVTTCPASAPGSNTVIQRDAAGNSEGNPAKPIQYNAYNQASKINGQDQAYHDLGNDLRVQAGATRLVNTQFGITARTTSAGTTYYTRMPDGRLLASHGGDGTHFYVTDYQKSVAGIIGANGQRAGTYRYAPYGEATLVEDTTAAQNNPFRWHSGYYGIEGDGYYKFGARYYDADGHFTQPDPYPGSMGEPLRLNPYGYSSGDPTNNSDPNGRSPACSFMPDSGSMFDFYAECQAHDECYEAGSGYGYCNNVFLGSMTADCYLGSGSWIEEVGCYANAGGYYAGTTALGWPWYYDLF